jgi:hypothetical protein
MSSGLTQINASRVAACPMQTGKREDPPMTSVSGKIDPVVRRITTADIAEALGQGLRDFQAAPLYGLAFGSA